MSAPLASHADRPVEMVVWDGRPAAVKHYRNGGAARTAEAMEVLWRSPFGEGRRPPGLPEVLTREGESVVMERIPGPALGRRGELGDTDRRGHDAAALLADLHGSGVEATRRRPAQRILRSLERKLGSIERERERRLFEAVLAALDVAALEGELVVSHGDFSPRNVLDSRSGLRLIDFDRCQMAPRQRDVAYWGAWAWATGVLAGGCPSWHVGDRFEAAYDRLAGRREPSVGHRAAHRAAALLRISHGWSALRERPEIAETVLAEALHVATSGS